MFGKDANHERRRLLADDVRRLAGLADFAVGEADHLGARDPRRCGLVYCRMAALGRQARGLGSRRHRRVGTLTFEAPGQPAGGLFMFVTPLV
jgi:hypothetical protein